jgi:hypothetical protein
MARVEELGWFEDLEVAAARYGRLEGEAETAADVWLIPTRHP